jgi:hypothetical protein
MWYARVKKMWSKSILVNRTEDLKN